MLEDNNIDNIILVDVNNNPISIILNDYKTYKTYGKYTIDLKQNNHLYISTYNYIKNKPINKYIFNDRKNFYEQIYNTFKSTNKNISCNILRHSYITKFIKDNPLDTTNDNVYTQESYKMGNSKNMFITYRKV